MMLPYHRRLLRALVWPFVLVLIKTQSRCSFSVAYRLTHLWVWGLVSL